MKLAFSNIAWDAAEDSDVRATLRQCRFSGIEIAPTKCWPDWEGARPESALALRAELEAAGFAVPALQAILFGKPDLKVFGSERERAGLVDHVGHVAQLATALGARTLVFGSPRNRDPGTLGREDAVREALPVFRAMGAHCAENGVHLGIEANPKQYGCRFLTRWRDAADFVRLCDHAGVRLHLDAACTRLAGDNVAEAVAETSDILAHVHISEAELGPFDKPASDHEAFAAALRRAGYEGWCSVEMRQTTQSLTAIETAARYALHHYG